MGMMLKFCGPGMIGSRLILRVMLLLELLLLGNVIVWNCYCFQTCYCLELLLFGNAIVWNCYCFQTCHCLELLLFELLLFGTVTVSRPVIVWNCYCLEM